MIALTENDLPDCSANQAAALVDIRHAGGSYHRFGRKGWLPPYGDKLSKAAREHFRHTDRTINSLVSSGYLKVTQEHESTPVQVTLVFP